MVSTLKIMDMDISIYVFITKKQLKYWEKM